ncbi:MAG: aspartate carbamoyltransferase catalytic subunit [Phycisphaerales bacterium]|nr:aspartate carbamoyltransferase catalytic subunit [Phycisphaerales bacterium]
MRTQSKRDLLELSGLSGGEIREYLDMARGFVPIANRPDAGRSDLRGRVVANLFFEDSTRTRLSFTLAAHRLGATTVDLAGPGSSASKGESLSDTARVVEAMGVDAIVVRAKSAGAARIIAGAVGCPVVNAGDGRHEHPTQGLLDCLTFAEAMGRLESFDLSGLTLGIVGDIVSSRVARSAIAGMTALGARVVCVGPPTMAPGGLSAIAPGVSVTHDFDAVLPGLDGVMMLRIQFERHGEGPASGAAAGGGGSGLTGSLREFRAFYALTEARAAVLRPGAVIMHPGPVNRGLELDPGAADASASLILRQVSRGVAVRMAVLARLLGQGA